MIIIIIVIKVIILIITASSNNSNNNGSNSDNIINGNKSYNGSNTIIQLYNYNNKIHLHTYEINYK